MSARPKESKFYQKQVLEIQGFLANGCANPAPHRKMLLEQIMEAYKLLDKNCGNIDTDLIQLSDDQTA